MAVESTGICEPAPMARAKAFSESMVTSTATSAPPATNVTVAVAAAVTPASTLIDTRLSTSVCTSGCTSGAGGAEMNVRGTLNNEPVAAMSAFVCDSWLFDHALLRSTASAAKATRTSNRIAVNTRMAPRSAA